MSTKNRFGTWVIPEEQVNEFLHKRINWNQLIRDCLVKPNHNTLLREEATKEEVKQERKKRNKGKSVWTKEFTFSFGE